MSLEKCSGLEESNEGRMFTLENPNWYPEGQGIALGPRDEVWIFQGEHSLLIGYTFQFSWRRISLVENRKNFLYVQFNIKILSNCKVQFSFSRVFGLINPNTLELQSVWIFQSKYPRERNCSLTEKYWKIQHTHFISKILLT